MIMNNNSYNPNDDIAYISTSILGLAFVLGIENGRDEKIIFDDIINETRKRFKYKAANPGPESESIQGAYDVIKKHHLYITRAARRNWNSIQIARYAAENE